MIHSEPNLTLNTAVSSQGKSGVEESETLLSALSDMLDSVEDDDGTLSPFDVLPDATFLNQPQGRDKSAVSSHTGATEWGLVLRLHMFIQVQTVKTKTLSVHQ